MKTLRAAEHDRPDLPREHRQWRRCHGVFDPERLVFLDESAVTTNMTRLVGRAPRGQRQLAAAPQGH